MLVLGMDIQNLLIDVQRGSKTQRKTITIIDPERLPEFFKALDIDPDLSDEAKAFIATALSGGCRVSEVLSLRRADYSLTKKEALVKCLKKKTEKVSKKTGKVLKINKVYRKFPLHSVAIKYLEIVQKDVRHFGKVFTLDRKQLWLILSLKFGGHFCPHSLRHSHISERLHKRGENIAKVADVMQIDFDTVGSYNHTNPKKVNEGYWD